MQVKKHQIQLTITHEIIIISSLIMKSDVEQMQWSSSFVVPIRIHHTRLNFQTLEAGLVSTTYFVSDVSMV